MCVIQTPVAKHSDIMGSPVSLDTVVVYVCDVVIVESMENADLRVPVIIAVHLPLKSK